MQNGTVVSEKTFIEFLYVHDLGPRSRNDIDLQYSHTFMNSISCLYLPTFRSHGSIVSEKNPLFSLFPTEKPKFPNLTLGQGHSTVSFEQTMMGRSPRCYIPGFVEIGPPLPEKKIFEGYLPYMGMAAILVM